MVDDSRLRNGDSWLVSSRFKSVIEMFHLPKHHFYEAKLLFKGEKLDYYLFHKQEYNNIIFEKSTYKVKERENYDFNSVFRDSEQNAKSISNKKKEIRSASELNISNLSTWANVNNKLFSENKKLEVQNYVFDTYYDYLFVPHIGLDQIVSEPVREKIEYEGITGFEFKELGDCTITFLNNI